MDGKGFCLWLNGLESSGKTALAGLLNKSLLARGMRVEVLDEKIVPQLLNRNSALGGDDLETGLKIIAFTANLLVRHQVVVVVAAANPRRDLQQEMRNQIDNFFEIFLDHSREHADRDTDAAEGRVHFETPLRPDLLLGTNEESTEESLARILSTLEMFGYIPADSAEGYSQDEIAELEKRLGKLGYM